LLRDRAFFLDPESRHPAIKPSADSTALLIIGVFTAGRLLLAAVLGLSASADQGQLTLERPRLPGWLVSVELQNVRVGKSRLTFRALRGQEGAAVELLRREGEAELVVRP